MSALYPYRLSYVTKSPIWGGTRLASFGIRSDAPTVGEAWMLTVRAAENSVILNGEYAGRPLGDVIGKEDFPLLVKLIDATDRLSVQVHPDDGYAACVEHDRGKTEMWYIVAADAGAEIIYGLADGVDRETFARAVHEGRYEDVMHHQPVAAGETYFIPSGMLHAIGKGILIAEIQQNCDLTYRVWDYGRVGKDGKPRELHVDKAIDVTRPFTAAEIDAIRYEKGDRQALADCRYFRVRKQTGGMFDGKDRFLSLLVIGGKGTLTTAAGKEPLAIGDSFYLPAGLGACRLDGDVTVLVSEAYTDEKTEDKK